MKRRKKDGIKVQYLDRSSYLLWTLRHYLLCLQVQLDTPRPSRPSGITGGLDGKSSRHRTDWYIFTVRGTRSDNKSCLSKSPKRRWKKKHRKEHVTTKTDDALKCVLKTCQHDTMQSSSADHFRYPVIELSQDRVDSCKRLLWTYTVQTVSYWYWRKHREEHTAIYILHLLTGTILNTILVMIVITALLHPTRLVSCPRILFPETIKLRTRGFPLWKNSCMCHHEVKRRKALYCKRIRHCDLIVNGWIQANQDLFRMRKINCCFSRCAQSTHVIQQSKQ